MAKRRRAAPRKPAAPGQKSAAPARRRAPLARPARAVPMARELPLWYVGLLALFVALPAIVAPYGHKYGYSPDLHMSAYLQVGAPAMIAALLFWHASVQGLALLRSTIATLLVAFLAWSLLTMLWAHNLYEALIKALDYSAAVLAGLLVAHTITRNRHALHWVLVALFWSGIALALLGIAQFLFLVEWVDQHAPPSATFNNKNMAAQYGLLTLPLGIVLFLRAKTPLSNWTYGIGSMIIAVFITYTRTRAAWLSLLLEMSLLAIFLLYEARSGHVSAFAQRGKIAPIVVALLGWLVAVHFDANGFRWFLSFVSDVALGTVDAVKFDGTGIPRIAIWSNTLLMIWENPFGVGLGNWVVEYPAYHSRVIVDHEMSESIQHINAHNDYLEFAAELGFIGVALLAGIAWRVGAVAKRMLISQSGDRRYLMLGVLLAVIGICFDAIFSFPFQQPVPLFLMIVYLGIVAANERGGDAPAAGEKGDVLAVVSNRTALLSAGAALSALSLAALLLHIRWFESEVEFRKATISSQRGQDYRMLLSGKRAFELNPLRDRMQNFIAMGHLRRGEIDQAIDAFEKVLDGYPHLIHTLNNAAMAYIRGKRFAEAHDVLRHLVEVRPQSAKAHKNLAVVLHHNLDRSKEALWHFKEALRLDINLPQADAINQVIGQIEGALASTASAGASGPADAVSEPSSR